MPDIPAMAAAVSAPGIDPREWVKVGVVDAVVVDGQGVFLDVTVQPDGYPVRAKMASLYAGDGFGLYCPVRKGDQVVLVVPDGTPDGIPVATGTLHNAQDALPSEAASDPESIWLVAERGKHVRLRVAGGTVSLDADRVEIGGWGTANPMTRWHQLRAILDDLVGELISHGHFGAGACTSMGAFARILAKIRDDAPASGRGFVE
jgi:hypothetical protein